MAVLTAHRAVLVETYRQRVQAAIPGYAALPPAALQAPVEQLIDAILASLAARDVSILGRFLEQATRMRLQQGFTPDSQITAARIMEALFREVLTRELAGDPAALAEGLRRVDAVAAHGRNAIGRVVLSTLTPPHDP